MKRFTGVAPSLLAVLLVFAGAPLGAQTAPAPPPPLPAVIQAAKASDTAALRRALSSGANVNTRDPDGMTALHYAAYRGDLEAAELLRAAKADLDAKDSLGLTPLHAAAFEGKGAFIKVLLQWGASAGARDSKGNTPLHYAVMTDHPDAAQALLAGGADAAAANVRGQSPAALAGAVGDPALAALFAGAAEGAKKPVRSYTNEDLVALRAKGGLAFGESSEPVTAVGLLPSAEAGASDISDPLAASDAYARIDRLIADRRILESDLPALQKRCDEFKARQGGAGSPTPDLRNNMGCEVYEQYKAQWEADRKAACGAYDETSARLKAINSELVGLRSSVATPTAPLSEGGGLNNK
jgi:hypothetical protein